MAPPRKDVVPKLVLTRALTYQHQGRLFRRGEPQLVEDQDYSFLIQQGVFKDPDQDVDFIQPAKLQGIPGSMEIPVIRDMGLGDVLIVSVALRELAAKYPRLRFVYAVDPRYVACFRDCHFLSRVTSIPQLHGSWAYGIDLRGYAERCPGCHTDDRLELYLRYLVGSPEVRNIDFPLYPTPAEVEQGNALARADGRPWILHAVRASQPCRTWPWGHVETLAEIAHDHGWRTVIVDPQARPFSNRLEAVGAMNLTGRTQVPDLMALVAAATVVVAPDTGVTHLAEAMKKRCVTYFTTVPPSHRLKHYRWTRALWARELDCLGCIHTPTCGLPDPKPCATLIAPEDVWSEIGWITTHEPPWPLESPRNWSRPLRTPSRWLGGRTGPAFKPDPIMRRETSRGREVIAR